MLVAEFAELMHDMPNRLAAMDHSAALQACVPVVHRGNIDNFGHGENIDGTKWARRKDNKDHPLLILTTALWEAVSGGAGALVEVGKSRLGMGVDPGVVPYFKDHQLGVPSRNLPKRQVFYIHGSNRESLRETFKVIELREIRRQVFGWQ